jgi:hypothetical protein
MGRRLERAFVTGLTGDDIGVMIAATSDATLSKHGVAASIQVDGCLRS